MQNKFKKFGRAIANMKLKKLHRKAELI